MFFGLNTVKIKPVPFFHIFRDKSQSSGIQKLCQMDGFVHFFVRWVGPQQNKRKQNKQTNKQKKKKKTNTIECVFSAKYLPSQVVNPLVWSQQIQHHYPDRSDTQQ